MKWEFLRVAHGEQSLYANPKDYKRVELYLKELGRNGWELVTVIADANTREFYFKRPLPELELKP